MRTTISMIGVGVLLAATTPDVHADAARAAIAETLTAIGTSANAVSSSASASDDRIARKKVAPAAKELGDDLAALARRTNKDAAMKSIATDAAAIEADAAKLLGQVDDVEDKDTRKALRAQIVPLQQQLAAVHATINAAAEKSDKPAAPTARVRFTGQLVNNSNTCSWDENLFFTVSANGQMIAKSGLVFPGKSQSLVLEKGSYLVVINAAGAGESLGRGTLEVSREGWTYNSGCVNQ